MTAYRVRYEIRPLGPWVEAVTALRSPESRFRAAWANTLELLDRETDMLGARIVVLQMDVTEGDIRRDGMLRANARVNFPGVRVAFDSKHGPLTYATDEYDSWKANIRAIALALESLRAVDRYGVTKRGEQYTGWKALPTAGAPLSKMSADDAAELLVSCSESGASTERVIGDPATRGRVYKAAARRWHPDVEGGSAEMFRRLTEARDLLEATR